MKDDKNIEKLSENVSSGGMEGSQASMNKQQDGSLNPGDETHNLDQEYVEDKKADLSSFKSMVSADPKQNIAILVVAAALIIGVGYYFFFGSGSKPKKAISDNNIPLEQSGNKITGQLNAPVLTGSSEVSPSYEVAVNPDLVPQSAPVPTPASSPQPASPTAPAKTSTSQVAPPQEGQPQIQKPALGGNNTVVAPGASNAQQIAAKIKSSIMLTGGAAKGGSASGTIVTRDLSNNFTPVATSAPASQLTVVGDMSSIITQGKIIETVLETPINTNYPGPIRSLVSRDVYSEMGTNILIPKGSRVLGTIAGGYTPGQTRVLITWNRIILPNGYDMQVQGSPGVDKLGMIGVEGIVDRQLWNTLGNALLISAVNIALADVVQREFNVGSQTSTVSTGTDGVQTSTNTLTPVQQSAQTQLTNLATTFQQWLSTNFTVKPFINLDQGTIVKIFVNADLQFPSGISSGVKIVK